MSEEEAKELINTISKEEFPYALAIAKAYEKLNLENKLLKEMLLEEKNTLVKQCELLVLNAMDCYCNGTDCSGRIRDSKQYDSLVQKIENQQKEFIKYLEDKIKIVHKTSIWEVTNIDLVEEAYEETLSKYKEIIGGVEDEK